MTSKNIKNLIILVVISCFFVNVAASTEEKKETQAHDDNSSSLQLLKEQGPLLGSFLTIIVSEIGDKTFILTAVLSAKYNKFWVFIGSFGALALMNFISCFIGNMSEYFIPQFYVKLFAAILFLVFGVKSIYEVITNKVGGDDSDDELENDIKQLEEKIKRKSSITESDKNTDEKNGTTDSLSQDEQITKRTQNESKKSQTVNKNEIKVSNYSIAILTFTQNFLGEWGDKSQLSTIAMSASFNFLSIFIGSTLAQFVCQVLAIIGGKLLAEKISERTLTLSGGILFVAYGISTLASIF